MSSVDGKLDLLAIGRSGVDIYPLQVGRGLEHVESFGKFLGGSPTNVAVATARMGRRSAIITAVGDDPFGRFVQTQMRQLGVDDSFVTTIPEINTPVTFCEIFPPNDFPLYFYRDPIAPDLQIRATHIPIEAVRNTKIFWFSASGLCAEPVRSAHHMALHHRLHARQKQEDREHWTIIDLDYRPRFWRNKEHAHREVREVLPYCNVAIGNVEECCIAANTDDPAKAAQILLDAGVDIVVVKQGLNGTMAKTADQEFFVPAFNVETLNGLGAGDAFGGSFCHALLNQWDLGRAIHFASAAGAIVASRLECSTAMPTQFEVEHLIRSNPDVTPQRTH